MIDERRARTVRSLAVLGGGTALAAVFGLGFNSLLAYWFGSTADTDAFFMSLSIYGFLAKFLMLSHLRSLSLPVYARLRAAEPERARGLAGGLVGLSTAFVTVATVGLLLAAPFLVDALAPGYQGEMRVLTVRLVRILIPGLIFLTGTTIAMAFLESEQRFGVTISAQKIVPAVIPLALLLLVANRMGISAVAWIDLIATIGGALVIVPVIRGRLGSPGLAPAARDPEIRVIARGWLGLSSSNAATFVGEWAFRIGASLLPVGVFSAVMYGRMVHDLLHAAINDSAQTVSLPRFSAALAGVAPEERGAALAPALRVTLTGLIALSLPLTLLVAATAPWSVALLFGRGHFLADGMVHPAAVSLSLFMGGFFLQGLVQIVFSACFATQRSDLINRVQLVGHLARAAALVPLAHWFSYVGLVGAQIGMNALVLTLFVVWSPREWGLRALGGHLLRPAVAALVPAVLYVTLVSPRLPDPIALGTLGRIGVMACIGVAWVLAYGVLAWLLKLPETELLRRLLAGRAAAAAMIALATLAALSPGRAAAQSWAPVREDDWALSAIERAEAQGAAPVGTSAVRPLPLATLPELVGGDEDLAQRFYEEHARGRWLRAGVGVALTDGALHPDLRLEAGEPTSRWFGSLDTDRTTMLDGLAGVKLGNAWIAVGRQRVRVGGSALGAIVLNPTAHLDGLQVGTAAPTRLGVLGDVSATLGVGPMHDYGAVHDPWWAYLRVTARPVAWLQIGASRAALAGGHFPGGAVAFDAKPYGPDVGSIDAGDVLSIALGRPTQFDDQVGALDARVSWARLGLPVLTYAELGWEDLQRSWGDPGLVAGALWAPSARVPITVRYEYAAFGRDARVCGWCDTLPAFWYQHVRFQSGWRTDDGLLGHPLGGYGHEHALAAQTWLDQTRLRTELLVALVDRQRWNLLEASRPGPATRIEGSAAWRIRSRLDLSGAFSDENGDGWDARSWRVAATAFF